MIDLLYNNNLIRSNEEFAAVILLNVTDFGSLITAANKEPKILKPVLNRYIDWFNRHVAPKAVSIVTA